MTISRRYFLKNGGIAMLGMASLPSFLQRAVAATASPNKKKMVVLFQRGASHERTACDSGNSRSPLQSGGF